MIQQRTGKQHPREHEVRGAIEAAAAAACPVYLAAWGDEFVKIGYSSDVRRRIKTIQSTCPTPVRMVGWLSGGASVEAQLHRRFAESRHVGEWFRFTVEIRDFIDSECLPGPAPIVKHYSHRYNLMDFDTVEQLLTRLDVEALAKRVAA